MVGAVALVVMFGTAWVAGTLVRRRFLPDWRGAPGRLAEIVVGLALLLAIAQALGTVGAFERFPVLVTCLACAAAAAVWTRRTRSRKASLDSARPDCLPGPVAPLVSGLLGGVLVAQWSARALFAMANGMSNLDTLWYHLPLAARFVQTGDVASLPPNPFDPRVPFYPANSELLHALVMLPFHADFAAGLVNLAALGLALLAGWCIGRPFGVAPATLVAVALVLAVPIFVLTQPGNATNDVLALAFFLAAVALFLNGRTEPAALACAGLAAGMAVGTKLTVGVAVLALTLGVIVLAEGRRRVVAMAWLPALAVSGGYWFVRNTVAVGSPLPAVKLGVGSLSLPHFRWGGAFATTFADYIGNGHVWRQAFLPALSLNFTRVWFLLLGLAAVGLIAAFARGTRLQRVLAVVGALAAVGFAFTPTTGYGGFLFSVRYLAPALALGLVLVPMTAARWGNRAVRWSFAALSVVALLVEILATRRWYLGTAEWEALGAIVAIVLVTAIVGSGAGLRPPRWVGAAILGAVAAGTMLGGWFIQRHESQKRYAISRPRGETFSERAPDTLRLFAWASQLRDQRLAVAGYAETFPLFGPDLSNRVDYLAHTDRFARQQAIPNCTTWRRRLRRDHPRFVVVAPTGYPFVNLNPPAEANWTRSDPNAVETLHAGPVEVFELRRPATEDRCPS